MLQFVRYFKPSWRMLFSPRVHVSNPKNAFSTESTCMRLVPLSHRSVVQVQGRDSLKLLQGLLTNDMTLLSKTNVIYSMVLNVQGRVECDVLIYNGEENEYLVECDTEAVEKITQLLRRYKLRSKVKFELLQDVKTYCLFSEPERINKISIGNLYKDPRLPDLGHRILTRTNTDDLLKNLKTHADVNVEPIVSYVETRYKLGISEGVAEVDNAIPLEHNIVFLNGVSFNKGCYIGQELVARAHHTGVIRKRIMPLRFLTNSVMATPGCHILNQKEKRIGKVIGRNGEYGIGLMRLKEAFNEKTEFHIQAHDKIRVDVKKPKWWPDDLKY
ncbi:putative transferase CAF17 homolog, mitochondrial [Hydractinia symbiolongicarpus]|uniref:putative transferase CAF17 homolog, mitochondrial n=1 Tax=Hydractinia symbiolongicarpus TaxID=13093 RepID=UPI002550A814|nr:putative transferase CAF17 homolog, mitochondrial [Hydractinia symbiolongicarpus]